MYERPTPDKSLEKTYDKKVPDVYEDCEKVLKSWRVRGGNWPFMMPTDTLLAVKWWIGMQEPFDERFENPRRVPTAGLKGEWRWECPYVSRVVANLRAFLKLPDDRQRIVVASREDGFWWRGESDDVKYKGETVWHFLLVLKQYEAQRGMSKDVYREKAIEAMKTGLRRMAGAGRTGGVRRRISDSSTGEAESRGGEEPG